MNVQGQIIDTIIKTMKRLEDDNIPDEKEMYFMSADDIKNRIDSLDMIETAMAIESILDITISDRDLLSMNEKEYPLRAFCELICKMKGEDFIPPPNVSNNEHEELLI